MITSFQGQYRFLSNFWPANVFYNGYNWPTAEHAYQSAKCPSRAQDFIRCTTPGDAKRLGRKVQILKDFDSRKLTVMEEILWQKFSPANPTLIDLLVNTGTVEIIEGNTWGDRFWGVCNGVGENHLGKLLMKLRGVLQ